MTKVKHTSIPLRIRWTALSIYRSIRGDFSKGWTKKTLQHSSILSDHINVQQRLAGSSNGLSSRWSGLSWPQYLLVKALKPSTTGSGEFEVYIVNGLIALILLFVSAVLGYWFQDREAPTDIKDLHAATQIVKPGGVLKIRYTLERRKSCHVVVEQLVYDGDGTRMEVLDEDFVSAPGRVGTDTFALAVPIPITATPGNARYRAIRSYFCNPVHTWFNWPVVVQSKDIMFRIDNDGF